MINRYWQCLVLALGLQLALQQKKTPLTSEVLMVILAY